MNSNLASKEEYREELINGIIVAMSPRPGWNHISVAANIYRIFSMYLLGKKCTAIPDGCDLHLSEKDVLIPDMMVVCDPDKIKPNGVYGAPDLVVEVLSPSTLRNDRTHKKNIYGQSGVKEYWLVDPISKSVEIYRAEGTELVLHDVYGLCSEWELEKMTEEERASLVTHFKCGLFDELDISLEDIFYRTF